MKSPTMLLQGLLADARRLESDVKGIDRDVLTIEERFKHEGYGFLTVALPSLCDALTLGLSTGLFACPSGFKKVRSGSLPRLFSGLMCEVFDSSSGSLKQSPNLGVVKCLREILLLFKKLKLDQESEEHLDFLACEGFFETDEKCLDQYDPDKTHHLKGVAAQILSDLSLRDLSELPAKHGPGAVQEGVKGNQKWSLLVERIRENTFDVGGLGYDTMAYMIDGMTSPISLGCDIGVDPPSHWTELASHRTSKLISVAKNSTSRRTITIEPLVNQFVQQGLNTILRDSISRCRVLSRCLDLTDQSKNQVLAMEGSRTGEWSTIDLKSASDLLSTKLVEIVFGRHSTFYSAMIDCRSPNVVLNRVERSIRKFAGMGNALTFPVQSVVFATLAIAAILHMEGHFPSSGYVKHAARHIRVFGDDIVVRTRYAHQVVVWLQSFGLTVNTKKSFLEGNFKESCGVDAFKGVDVTPLYIKSRPDDSSKEPNAIAGLVSLSNQAWLRGLYSFSAMLREEVESRLRRRLPLCTQRSGALGWHSHLDGSDIHSWNPTLHRFEQKTYVQVPLKRKDRLDDYAALLKFFHVPLEGRDRGHLEKTPIRFSSRIVLRKVPV